MKMLRGIAISLMITTFVVMLSCASFQNAVTPCWIEQDVGNYTGEDMTSILPYTTIADAERLQVYLTYTHQSNQIEFMRLSEDDVRKVDLLMGIQKGHIQRAAELKEQLFSATGPGGLLAAFLPGLGLGAFLIPRKKDTVKIKELENGKTV
jgi:hypothetical protein